MAVPLSTIYSWFQTGDFPTEVQFQQTFASFRHKDTPITADEIQGLAEMFNGTASLETVISHIEDPAAHIDYLATADASNITGDNLYSWRVALGITDIATVDGDVDEGNVYTKAQVNDLLAFLQAQDSAIFDILDGLTTGAAVAYLKENFVEDEVVVTAGMIATYVVTVPLSEDIDEAMERTIYYNGQMVPLSMNSIAGPNIEIDLAELLIEPSAGDVAVVKYYKI